jgi:hypothetical protein
MDYGLTIWHPLHNVDFCLSMVHSVDDGSDIKRTYFKYKEIAYPIQNEAWIEVVK